MISAIARAGGALEGERHAQIPSDAHHRDGWFGSDDNGNPRCHGRTAEPE